MNSFPRKNLLSSICDHLLISSIRTHLSGFMDWCLEAFRCFFGVLHTPHVRRFC